MTQPATESQPAPAKLSVRSSAFAEGAPIPKKYTEDGQNISPPLQWSGAPASVKEYAVIVDDPDAPRPQPWVHWVMYHIRGDITSLPENIATTEPAGGPPGVHQGKNTWERIGYGGPAPPKGHGTHHYHFRIYALDSSLLLEAGKTKEEVLAAMKGHVLAEGETIGTYERK